MALLNLLLPCLRRTRMVPLVAGLCLASAASLRAATIQAGDVTTVLGPTFYLDNATNGGGDADINQPGAPSYDRFFDGLLARNQGPTRVTLTGFGFAAHTSVTANDATSVAVTFTYLGANELPGGGDDVVIGTATGTYNFTVGGEYVFAFDTPLTADLTITGTLFRIQIAPTNASGTGSLKLKTPATGNYDPKLSVAGFVAPLINPQRLNLAKFQPVTVSSVAGQRLASYVTDGVTGNDNRWESANSQWNTARVDFPFPVQVGSAQVFTGVDDTLPVSNFSVQYLDGSTWVTIPGASVSGNTNVERNLVFTSSITASSFRIIGQDSPLRIRELALYPPNGPGGYPLGTDLTVNLAYQRPATASANTAGNFAMNAVDGRANAFMWQTTTAGTNTLDIDLRASTKIGSAHLYSGSTGVSPLAAFTMKYWNGTVWQDISGGTLAGNTTSDLVVPFSTPVITSKVRLEFTNPGTTSIRELCIFPANTGNTGYPVGTNIIGSGAIARYDDYNDAFYRITNPASGRFMAVASGGQPALDQAGLTTAQGQYQVLLNISNGTYRLRNRATGECLSGARLSKTPGEALIDAPYSALPHQDWILDPLGGGVFQIINQWSGLVIDTQGGATSAGTPLVQNTTNSSTTQRWQFSLSTRYPKKGVGGTSFATAFNVDWAYNWGLTFSQGFPADAVYNPMQWGDFYWDVGTTSNASTWKSYSNWRTASQSLHLMAFNEPDTWSQSGRSLDPANPPTEADFSSARSADEAVMLWPRLQAMDIPMVAPCPANMNGGWLASFYTQANALGYRVDYTAKHSYPSPNGGSSDNLINDLQTGYTTWGKPMWLTEFSFVDWGGTATWTEEDNYNCLAEFLWRAESVDWLRKYALFVFTEDASNPAPAQPWSAEGPRSNARDASGNLTPFGELYAAWDSDAVIRANKTYYVHQKGTRKRLANLLASTPGGSSIRINDTSVKWTLVASPTANQYFLTSSRDGRRLSYDNTTVSLAAAGTTGTAVQWSLTEDKYGWYYLGHPATSKRLKLVYNNTTGAATFSMVVNTTTGDSLLWRFIVPSAPPVWSGASGTSWVTAGNWSSASIPSTGDAVSFDSTSTSNLSTVLNQDFNLDGLTVTSPTGPVSIGGTNSLTIGASGIDLTGATQNLTITAPVILGGAQNWSVTTGRTLNLNGGVSGGFPITVAGAGDVALGASIDPLLPLTVAAGATLRTSVSGVFSNASTAVNMTMSGTLDLNGTSQSVNALSGSGVIDNTAAGAGVLTVGNNDVAVALNVLLQNTAGTLALVKTGSGALTLPLANTFGGGFTNNGTGNVMPQNSGAFGTGPLVMNAGTLYSTPANYSFSNALTLNGATLRVGGGASHTLTWSGPVNVTADSGLSADGSTAGITLSGGLNMNNGGHTFTSFANGTANTISAPVSGAGGTIMVTLGTLNLNAANPFGGNFRSSAGGPLKIGDALAMQNATLDMNAADAGSVSLNNLSATLGALTGSRNLGLGSGAVSIGNNNLSTAYSGVLSGTGSLVKTGTGTLTLSGANSYTGSTSVIAGTLALGAGNVLPTTAVSIGNATLDAATFTDTTGVLDLTGTAKINLAAGAALVFANSSAVDWTGGSLTLTGTFVPGVSLRFGTTSGGLTPTQLALISVAGFGPVTLNSSGYLTAVAAGGYTSWKTANGTTQTIDLDHDNDGVANGVEYFLGGNANTTGFTPLPGVANNGASLSVTWTKAATGYTGTYGADFVVETSPDLSGIWTAETLGGTVTITGNDVKYTFPAGTRKFVRLKVTGP